MEAVVEVDADEVLSAIGEASGVVSTKGFIQFLRDIQVLDGSLTQDRARTLLEYLIPRPKLKESEDKKGQTVYGGDMEVDLVFSEFVEMLVACSALKDPNPFVPMKRRFEVFVRKEVVPAVSTILKDGNVLPSAARTTIGRRRGGIFTSGSMGGSGSNNGGAAPSSPRVKRSMSSANLTRSRSMTMGSKK